MAILNGNANIIVTAGSSHAHSTTVLNGVYSGSPATTFTIPAEINWNPAVDPIVNRCAKEGHVMSPALVELEDGGVSGMCEQCGQIITGRRIAGGMSLLKLRKALEDAVNGEKDLVADEYLKLAEEVDAEEAALVEARSLLRLAERALFARKSVAA